MAAPTPIAIDAPLPPTVKRQYSFTDFSQNNPTTPPLGNRIDAEYDRINNALNTVISFCSEVKQLAPALTDSKTVAGADPTDLDFDYTLVAQAWAEYMPDTIPPNILAVMNITGDHWSSRWWAHQAGLLVQNAIAPALARYIYASTAGQTIFSGPDRDGHILAVDAANQQAQVFQRGILKTPVNDYTQTRDTVTLVAPAGAGDIVQILVTAIPAPVPSFEYAVITSSQTFIPPTHANYTLFVANPATGPLTLTLGNGVAVGQTVTIKDTQGNAGTYPVDIVAPATIDNNPTYTLYSDFASLTVVWLGTLWGTV